MKNKTILGLADPLTIQLSDGKAVEHLGAASVIDGHLYLTENPAKEICSVKAIYAPGVWVSVKTVK